MNIEFILLTLIFLVLLIMLINQRIWMSTIAEVIEKTRIKKELKMMILGI